MDLIQKITRFRAYQLGNEGSSFSYYDGSTFTLIEARLTEISKPNVLFELEQANKKYIDTLHITSWDNDHCRPNELKDILEQLRPNRIEYPGYEPHTESGETSIKLIKRYEEILVERSLKIKTTSISPRFIKDLNSATGFGYSNIIYHPDEVRENSNDNSTVKLFRSGSFTVLSLGDVESSEIAESFMKRDILTSETDVMILAHHGADNGFTTKEFINAVKPKVAICSSNYDNKFNHPKPEIRDLLYQSEVQLFTTKTGDVVIKSINEHIGEFQVFNLISNSEKISSEYKFISKRLE